jgi:circadian clock protein KaiB
MNDKTPADTTAAFELAVAHTDVERYTLRLYVTGMTPRSLRAIENIKRVCEVSLKDRYSLEVVDIYRQPELAGQAQIIAAPTLIKALPLPLRRIIGDLSDREKVLVGLDLKKRREE